MMRAWLPFSTGRRPSSSRAVAARCIAMMGSSCDGVFFPLPTPRRKFHSDFSSCALGVSLRTNFLLFARSERPFFIPEGPLHSPAHGVAGWLLLPSPESLGGTT
jgi:hypothetical protein